MEIKGWKYYKHAAVPSTPPHEEPDLTPMRDKSIWKMTGSPLLARWTTDFDCGYETNWWYVIKDTPFDINALKAKRRYEINKANKHFVVKEINPSEWSESIYRVTVAAYETYPKAYRPNIEHDGFIAATGKWRFYKVYGAFSVMDESLCGFACLSKKASFERYIDFTMMKSVPDKEKLGVNAALVCKVLLDHQEFLCSGGYICDGARNVLHETAFQDYLEKYFAFRKAYCKLNIKYKGCIKLLVKILFPISSLLSKVDNIGIFHKVNGVLLMERIRRSF